MAFPDTVITDNESAGAFLTNKAKAAGLDLSGLQPIAQLQSAVGNLLVSDPSTVTVPAGDVLSGTFGANKSGGADTGTYTFPGAVVITTTGSLTGLTYTTSVASATALATPSAFVATRSAQFASTVSGAVVMGFGTTNDVTLMNQAGTVVLGVTANTTGVTMAGALAITGAFSGATTGSFTGALTLLSVTAGATPGSVGTTPATAAPTLPITTNIGGATTIVTTGVGGKGGDSSITTGAGGTAALAATAGTGGAGGDYSVTTGAGAASAVTGAGTGTGGKGGAIALVSGVGGATSVSTGVNVGGASGAITFTTSAGGASTNGSSNTGGASGVITLATGAGGAGATAQGASGAIALTTGASTASVGTVSLNPGGLAMLTASWISATVGQIVIGGTYGAGVASMRYNGLTTAAVANQAGTLTNAPVVGNPTFWMPVSIAGVIKYVPHW